MDRLFELIKSHIIRWKWLGDYYFLDTEMVSGRFTFDEDTHPESESDQKCFNYRNEYFKTLKEKKIWKLYFKSCNLWNVGPPPERKLTKSVRSLTQFT